MHVQRALSYHEQTLSYETNLLAFPIIAIQRKRGLVAQAPFDLTSACITSQEQEPVQLERSCWFWICCGYFHRKRTHYPTRKHRTPTVLRLQNSSSKPSFARLLHKAGKTDPAT
jgi:hypothetical protein